MVAAAYFSIVGCISDQNGLLRGARPGWETSSRSAGFALERLILERERVLLLNLIDHVRTRTLCTHIMSICTHCYPCGASAAGDGACSSRSVYIPS